MKEIGRYQNFSLILYQKILFIQRKIKDESLDEDNHKIYYMQITKIALNRGSNLIIGWDFTLEQIFS